jgi:two-component system sensor histidine kinase KdpD
LAIDDVVAEAVKRMARLFTNGRIQLELPTELPLVRGDYIQLEQVMTNLLENASRHAPKGSTVRVGAQEFCDDVEVWVDDEGAGVPPFERQRIFEPFRRGEGSSSSGIGLAICKAVVEAHDGRIHVEGSATGGSRFTFTLPKA